jgi:hypothetical protein
MFVVVFVERPPESIFLLFVVVVVVVVSVVEVSTSLEYRRIESRRIGSGVRSTTDDNN